MRQFSVFLLVSLLLFPLVFAGCSAFPGDEQDPVGRVVLVPLDDRPVHLLDSRMVGQIARVEVNTPPREILGSFTDPGEPEQIAGWLRRSLDDASALIVSADMLAYGGLVASRTFAIPTKQALSNLEVLREIRTEHPDLPIYVYDTIQRLAITITDQTDLRYHAKVRRYGVVADLIENLGKEEYRAEYEALQREIPKDLLNDYLQARRRNFAVNRKLVSLLNEGVIDFLVLGQDDAAEYGLHRAEKEELVVQIDRLGLADKALVFPGADELSALLVTRAVVAKLGITLSVYPFYSIPDGGSKTARLEDITIAENISRHVKACGGEIAVEPEDADLLLAVNVPTSSAGDDGPGFRDEDALVPDLAAFTSLISRYINAGRPVAVADLRMAGRADPEFTNLLLDTISLLKLTSYSAWNTAGNTLGLALSGGLARRAALKQGSADHAAYAEYLLYRFSIDYGYHNEIRPAAEQFASARHADIWNLGEQRPVVDRFVSAMLTSWVRSFYNGHFLRRPIGESGVLAGRLENIQIHLPWPRLFETELEFRISTS